MRACRRRTTRQRLKNFLFSYAGNQANVSIKKDYNMTNAQRTEQLENDLVDYIMGLWDQEKRFRTVKDYQGVIKLKGNTAMSLKAMGCKA